MSLRTDMVDLILENEANKEKLREAQRLLDQVLHTPPTPAPYRYVLDEYFTIGTTHIGNLKLVRTRTSYYADLRIKTGVNQHGSRELLSIEVLER